MTDNDLIAKYNYPEFRPEYYEQWMRYDDSPDIGTSAPDFALWNADDQSETRLSDLWSAHKYLVVEFGSFT